MEQQEVVREKTNEELLLELLTAAGVNTEGLGYMMIVHPNTSFEKVYRKILERMRIENPTDTTVAK